MTSTIRLAACLAALFAACLSSCSKKSSPDGGGTSVSSSKYVVDTYAKSPTGLFYDLEEMCVDDKGVLYVSQTQYDNILKIDPILQTIGNFAGMAKTAGCVDDPFGSGAPSLTFPGNLWINNDNLIFIGDYGCGKAKVATTTGILSSVEYENPYNLDPGVSGACEDYEQNIYLYGTYTGLYEVRASDHVLVSVVDDTNLGIIGSMTMDNNDKNVYLSASHQVFELSEGSLRSIAGNPNQIGNVDGQGKSAAFGGYMVICMGGDGNIYVADTNDNTIREVTPNGVVTTIAGDGNAGYTDGSGDKAEFNSPRGIAYASTGDGNVLYVSDNGNNVIRRIKLPK
ncbi:MAG TPA: hypothetical protein VG890_10825 [Puia sp.]|nr:hypothetical protein [Puia sp.]